MQQKMSPDWVRQMLDSYSTLCDTFCWEDPREAQSLNAALEHSRRVMVEEKAKFQMLWDLMPRRYAQRSGGASATILFRDGPLACSTAEDRLRTMARRHEERVRGDDRTREERDRLRDERDRLRDERDRLRDERDRLRDENDYPGLDPTSDRMVSRQIEWSSRRMTTSDRWAELMNDPLPKSHPKLSKLLRIHRHGPRASRGKAGRLDFVTPGGHVRAKSAPLMDWGGTQPVLSSKKPSPVTVHNPDTLKEVSPRIVPPFPTMQQQITKEDASTTRSGVVSTRSRPAVSGKAPNLRELLSPTRELHERVKQYVTPKLPTDVAAERDASSSSSSPSVTREAIQNLRLELPPVRNVEINFEPHGYKHLSFLAEGSLGVLHLVESLAEPGTLWVAKLVDLTLVRNRNEASQALLEAELLCRLQHPNIVAYRASFIHNDYLVIIMEYCEAGDLQTYLQRCQCAVEEPLVLKWLCEICNGLSFMHSRHVLHCDLKSSNVFLNGALTAKIGDLGIARELSRGAQALSPRRCPRGTPLYMSPEMCQREALTERSDCWAVGCIIYEVCNLKHAFSSNLNLDMPPRLEARTDGRAGRPFKDNESVLSAISGFTHRSDLSLACKRMLRNIKGDIRRLKKTAAPDGLPTLVDGHHLSYWRNDGPTVARLLPQQYGPLLNYMVCAMLEPRPRNRPSLSEIAQLARAACGGDDEQAQPTSDAPDPPPQPTKRPKWFVCRTCFNP